MDEKKPGETRLLVWNAATGNVVQRMDDPKAINFIPIPSAGKAVIQETINDDCQEGGLTLIKLSSGTRESLPAGLVTTAIADQRGTRIYVARGKPASTNDDCGVYGEHGAIIGAIDAKTGKAVWEQPVPENLQDVLISPDSKFLIGYGFLEHPITRQSGCLMRRPEGDYCGTGNERSDGRCGDQSQRAMVSHRD